ncbi:MAG: Rieske (2Fe-2S) protein [Pseudomonadota bacterium]
MGTLCRADEIGEDEARGYEYHEHSLVVVRRDGRLHVYVNWCPHLGIELNYQPDEFFDYDQQFLQCANHGALFEIDTGLCILGPCKGASLRKVDFVVENGDIRITHVPQRIR